MSKNGYLLFRNYDPYVTSSFGNRVNPITNIYTLHAGVDYGTNREKLPTYAIETGRVVRTGFSNVSGNFVYVNYPRLKKTGLYQHLDRISVSENQIVDSNTIIGYVGDTGQVTGIHLHFGWFSEDELSLDWYSRNWEDFEEYEYKVEVAYFGEVVLRDELVNQVEVLVDNLRARKAPNGDILGYINPGIYNILESRIEKEYTWLLVDDNIWIAYDSNWAILYPKKEIDDEEDILDENEEVLEEDIDNLEKSSFFDRIIRRFSNIFEKILNFFNNLWYNVVGGFYEK